MTQSENENDQKGLDHFDPNLFAKILVVSPIIRNFATELEDILYYLHESKRACKILA